MTGLTGILNALLSRGRNARSPDAAASQARDFAQAFPASPGGARIRSESGKLFEYFSQKSDGPGLWKWEHYFAIYERHFARFVGKVVNVLEVGIYSGGSLAMWREYFGPKCHLYGVDIEPACRSYETEDVTVLIGDQADRAFWRALDLPQIDVLIDDGGHLPHQQIVTLEEMLPRMASDGVYLCEDVHGSENEFTAYVHGLAQALNAANWDESSDDLAALSTTFQRSIASIHSYPFVTVIEKAVMDTRFVAPRRGTQWQPYSGKTE